MDNKTNKNFTRKTDKIIMLRAEQSRAEQSRAEQSRLDYRINFSGCQAFFEGGWQKCHC